jgi:hypothetical protein
MGAVPSGSYLVLSQMSSDLLDPETQDGVEDVVGRMFQQKIAYRDRKQMARFFADMELAEPGLVPVEEWRPEPGTNATGESALWGAVGRKR